MDNTLQEFNRLQRLIDGAYHEAAVRLGLSDSELWLIYILSSCTGGCPQAELCRATAMTKTTVNSALKKLERQGIVRLTPDGGRSTRVLFTEEGAALAARTAGRLMELESGIYEGWTPEERALLLRLNRDFAEKLSARVRSL